MNQYQTLPKHRLGIGLLRVSTDRQFQEGESIESQRRKVEFVARRDNIDIVRFFVEHYSGRKTDRKVIDEVFEYLGENQDIEVAIVGEIDRFTRGGSEIYLRLRRELRELGVSLLDTTGIIQPERNRLEHLDVEYSWAVDSPSRFAEVFMAEKARAEASDILTRTIGQQIQLTRDGYQCRGSNFGYRNAKITTKDGKKKTTLVTHETEAPWIIRMFELKADGSWRDDAICEAVNAMGYRSRPMNIYHHETREVLGQTGPKRLDPKQLQKFISRTIYCGVRCEQWNRGKPVLAPIKPLVSIDLFNRANRGKIKIVTQPGGELEIRESRDEQQSHRHNPDFLLRHVVSCNACAKPLVASKSRGKSGKYFGYYHCSRKHAYFGVRKSEFDSTVANYLDQLCAKPGFLGLFREVVRDVWVQKNRSAKAEVDQIDVHINTLERKQAAVLTTLSASRSGIVQEKLEAQVEEIECAIKSARKSRSETEITEGEIEAYFQRAKKLMEHPRQDVFSAPTKEKLEKVWGFIFRTRPRYRDLVDGTPDLTLIYRLSGRSNSGRKLLAGELSLQWNTFVADVKWQNEL